MKDQSVYLKHMLEAIQRIKDYTKNMDVKAFFNNNMVEDAVVRNIEIIGEASKNLSAEFKKKYSDVPWKDISGMRDRIVHFYFGLDFGLVWNVVEHDLPKLEKSIRKILEKGVI
ncbi:TPA: DUF86 domain-containing protein [Candidatus Micrarchaeota archaeon]|nr:DUF86 domain-containing protein [Candidatus Micrarchaeota archaeon]